MRVAQVVLTVAVVLLAALALLWSQQRRLIYSPAPRAVPPAATVLPGAEEISFPTEDGLRLAGWFVPATGPPGRRPGQPRSPAVLVCNGNGGNRSMRAPLAAALARRERAGSRVAVMFIDLDRFKEVNDEASHTQGDVVLRRVGSKVRVLKSGGDHFDTALTMDLGGIPFMIPRGYNAIMLPGIAARL